MKKKHIAIIGLKGLPAFGGAARSFENILDVLKQDYDFTVYAVDSHTDHVGDYNGINQIVFKSTRNSTLNIFLYYIKSMCHVLFIGKYDLIHMNHAESGFVIPLLRLRYKVITTFHGVYNKQKFDSKFSILGNAFFRLFQRINIRFSNRLVSVSKDDQKYIQTKTHKPVQFIPNGVFLNDNVQTDAVQMHDYLMFAAGRIYGIKGCHLFLEALQKIHFKGKALIIGDLNHEKDYKEKIEQLAQHLDVDFIDLIYEKALLMAYLKKARLFVFPSLFEAMSNMLLEAASQQTPVICSDIVANTDVFNDDEVTFFKSGDSCDLAKSLEWALKNEDALKTKANRALNKLSLNYTWERVCNDYKKLYDLLTKS